MPTTESQSVRHPEPCAYDTDTCSEDESGKAGKIKFVGPRNASAKAYDPAYRVLRAQPLPLPMIVTSSGRLNSVEVTSDGWPMYFCNPMKPSVSVNFEDFQRVLDFLTIEFGFLCLPVELVSVGVYQVKLGSGGKGQGNLQLWVTRFDHPEGNCRFHGSVKHLLEIRTPLSRSKWFLDTVGFKQTLPVAYGASRMLLPAVNTLTPLYRI